MARFIRDTIVGGTLFLVPIMVLIAILEKAHRISSRIVVPIAERIPMERIIGIGTGRLLAILLIILFCFLTGLFAKTSVARRFGNRLEGSILSKIPGYSLTKGMVESLAGIERGTVKQAVLARIEDAWQLACLVERIEPGHVAVFVPGSPDPKSGTVFFLTEDRIRPLDIPLKAAMECVKLGGKGSDRLLRGRL